MPPFPPSGALPQRPASASEVEGKPLAALLGSEQDSGNESVHHSSDTSTTHSRDNNGKK